MSQYQLYSYQHWEKGLGKYLFEDTENSLYLWMDKRQLLHKIQFEYHEKLAFELSANSNCVHWVSNFIDKGKHTFATIFNRSFSQKSPWFEDVKEAISKIEVKEIKNWPAIQQMMLCREWNSLFISFQKSQRIQL